ncbi:hypothetical protein COT63_01250 [Candidatus Shapirobacteria bacterium CG09_land_8_20_14_0_10_38_17]|uniref:Amine oxidase domain-containing protein n=1 Tax=Candidatus Shapirobacteria bacterium CG09_land_8_20_14_0_10_38_17 TaxID=1974884 RepID=A0A2H0WTG3_9BACT|nr:MAG: hypothetical protein COT63_01250 [Candidatus Shapirobacteria bacterium CG09_land_8_20_14_0_10_38_17]
MSNRIAIIGGGITGLTLAYRLSPRNKVTVFEKEKVLGGLAISFKKENWQWPLENFYHHLFTNDKELLKLLKDLKINYFFSRPKTSIYQKGQIYQFDSAISLLTYPHLNLYQKLRAGTAIAILKTLPNEKLLREKLAVHILPQLMGDKAYQVLWEPLLCGKFGQQMNQISAGWIWARIKKRSQKLGYIKNGYQYLIDRLTAEIKKNKGQIKVNYPIKNLNQLKNFSKIIVTTSPPIFLKIAPALPQKYKNQLASIKMLAALNLILVTKKPLLTDNTYWLNISDRNFPFVALVQHTNFINPHFYNGNHILYIGGYYPQNHPYLKMNKESLLKKFLPYLKKINHHFQQSAIINYQLSKSLYAQPIVTPHYQKTIPSYQTPIDNVYLVCMEQIYPWDRGINYTIKTVNKLANLFA